MNNMKFIDYEWVSIDEIALSLAKQCYLDNSDHIKAYAIYKTTVWSSEKVNFKRNAPIEISRAFHELRAINTICNMKSAQKEIQNFINNNGD